MESKPVEEEKKEENTGDDVAAEDKHAEIKKDAEGGEVTLIENKVIQNTASPFLADAKSWDDEELGIPA